MEKSNPKNTSLILLATPLIIYVITFTFFVVYYIQQETLWFKISCLAIAVSALTSLIKILSVYSKWSTSSGGNKREHAISLFVDFLFLALYLFCLLIQTDQWTVPVSPPLIAVPLLAVPLLIAFVAFLYSDTRDSRISK